MEMIWEGVDGCSSLSVDIDLCKYYLINWLNLILKNAINNF